MNDEELISKLNNTGNIEPENKEFFVNLKKRLVNQRIETTSKNNEQELAVEVQKPSPTLFTSSFIMGILSIFIMVTIVTVMIFGASFTKNQDNNLSQSKNLSDNQNQQELIVNGNVITSTEYNFEDLAVYLALPSEWINKKEVYDLAQFEFPKFINSDKELILVQATTEDLAKIAKYEVQADKIIKVVEPDGSWDTDYDNNYIYSSANSNTVLVFSADDEQDLAYFEAIVTTVEFLNPFDGWIDYYNEDIGLEFKYPGQWQESYETTSTFLSRDYGENISLQIELSDEFECDFIETEIVNLSGRKASYFEDEDVLCYTFYINGKVYSAKIALIDKMSNQFVEVDGIDEFALEEIAMILSSIRSLSNYSFFEDNDKAIELYYSTDEALISSESSDNKIIIDIKSGKASIEIYWGSNAEVLLGQGEYLEYEIDGELFMGSKSYLVESDSTYEVWDLAYRDDSKDFRILVNFVSSDEVAREIIIDILERIILN